MEIARYVENGVPTVLEREDGRVKVTTYRPVKRQAGKSSSTRHGLRHTVKPKPKKDVYLNPPDSYEIALAERAAAEGESEQRQAETEAMEREGDDVYTNPPDGWAIALGREEV